MQGSVAIITGASSGIGWSTGLLFASRGAKVALVARRQEKLDALAAQIQSQVEGAELLTLAADLSLVADMERTIEATVARFGRLDTLVNAAGIIGLGTIEDTSLADYDAMMAINTRSPFYLTQLALPHLLETQGSVVNVSSVTGVRSFPGVLAYCVSKAAVDQLTRCAALEVADRGVRINAINPGVVRTNLHKEAGIQGEAYAAFLEHSKTTHPLGRVGEPEEVAALIAFLASPEAGWITGVTIPIDGGRAQTCAR